jgi:hypothetical protein
VIYDEEEQQLSVVVVDADVPAVLAYKSEGP